MPLTVILYVGVKEVSHAARGTLQRYIIHYTSHVSTLLNPMRILVHAAHTRTVLLMRCVPAYTGSRCVVECNQCTDGYTPRKLINI